jgi:hypothetical protein
VRSAAATPGEIDGVREAERRGHLHILQVDPVEGGTDNAYAYVNDPINASDLNGEWSWANTFDVINVALLVADFTPGLDVVSLAIEGVELIADAYRAARIVKNAERFIRATDRGVAVGKKFEYASPRAARWARQKWHGRKAEIFEERTGHRNMDFRVNRTTGRQTRYSQNQGRMSSRFEIRGRRGKYHVYDR